MHKFESINLFVFFIASLVIWSCVDHDLATTTADGYACDVFREVSFASDVKPVIESNCAISGCHNGANGADLNWLVFSNFQSNAADVKDRVTRPAGTPGHMPLTGSLSQDQIKLLVCWVEQGAQNN